MDREEEEEEEDGRDKGNEGIKRSLSVFTKNYCSRVEREARLSRLD